jgi:hypothetical protein
MRCFAALGVLAVWLGVAGCAPSDPLDRVVSVPTASRFATWRSAVASDSSAALRQQVENALQEIRVDASADRQRRRILGEPVKSAGTEDVDEAVRSRVDGKPLREVVQLGCELRLRRLTNELKGLEEAVNQNAGLVTRPGDGESRRHLDELRGRQLERVAKYREDIAATERELAPLLAKTGRRVLAESSDKVEQMPVKR